MVQDISPHYSPSARVDWKEAKRAFIEREERPTLEELAKEFGGTGQRMSQVANEEGWAIQRAERLENRLREAETGTKLNRILEGDRVINEAARNAALALYHRVTAICSDLEATPPKSLATRSQIASNLSFALQNTCSAMKHIGVTGIAKALNGDKEASGWNPSVLVQINQNLNKALEEKGVEVEAKPVHGAGNQTPTPHAG